MTTMKRLSCAFLLLLLASAASAQEATPPADTPLAVRTGAARGPVQLTVFCDIEEEGCERLVVILSRIAEIYGERVGITFRHHALEEHARAASAYRAALAAARQGKGWAMLEMASVNRDRLDEGGLRSMAEQLQLDLARFDTDLAASEVARVFEDDQAAAKAELGQDVGQAARLPVVFLNGTRLKDASTFDALEAAIKSAIKSAIK